MRGIITGVDDDSIRIYLILRWQVANRYKKREPALCPANSLLKEEEKFSLTVSLVLRRLAVGVLDNSGNCEKKRLIPALNCRYWVYRAICAYLQAMFAIVLFGRYNIMVRSLIGTR